MNDNNNVLIKRPGISLKDIANGLNTSTNTVNSAINFHNNSPLAKQIRLKYLEQLKKELEFIEQTEKFFI